MQKRATGVLFSPHSSNLTQGILYYWFLDTLKYSPEDLKGLMGQRFSLVLYHLISHHINEGPGYVQSKD